MSNKREQVSELFKNKKIFLKHLQVKFINYETYKPIYLIKKNAQVNSVIRNKIKRRIRNASYLTLKNKYKICIAFYLNYDIYHISFKEILNDFLQLKNILDSKNK